jgi:hypothetical protein
MDIYKFQWQIFVNCKGFLNTIVVDSILYINICLSTSLESRLHGVNFVSPELFHYKNISYKKQYNKQCKA